MNADRRLGIARDRREDRRNLLSTTGFTTTSPGKGRGFFGVGFLSAGPDAIL